MARLTTLPISRTARRAEAQGARIEEREACVYRSVISSCHLLEEPKRLAWTLSFQSFR